MNKGRLEAFSDGVLAIIITIMVLELKTPHGVTWEAIRPIIPVLISYVLSFIIIGTYWGNHHHLLHTVTHVTSGIIWANLHLLFWLSLIPFATAWMGESSFDGIHVAVYGGLQCLCGIAYYILLRIVAVNNPGNEELMEALRKQSGKGLISLLIYGIAIPVALIQPIVAAGLFALVSIIWFIPDRNIEKAMKN
jgi:uncharacterized membrane protein